MSSALLLAPLGRISLESIFLKDYSHILIPTNSGWDCFREHNISSPPSLRVLNCQLWESLYSGHESTLKTSLSKYVKFLNFFSYYRRLLQLFLR